jgi:putative membrane protein
MDSRKSLAAFLHIFPLVAIAKRLGLWLAVVVIYCLLVGWIVHEVGFRLPDWSFEAGLVNSVILGLLLNFRNRTAYDRWWEARRLWGQLTNDSRNLAWKLAAFVPPEVVARSSAAALLMAFPEALKRHLRRESFRLRDLPGFEKESDNPDHVPSYLAGRLYAALAGWMREGHVNDQLLRFFDPHLSALLDICGGCERILNTPISPSYKGLLRTGLVLNILVAPWYAVAEIGFWGVLVFLLVCFFLLGVELIDSIVEEPFGREADDLDLERYCETIRHGVSMSLPIRSEPFP